MDDFLAFMWNKVNKQQKISFVTGMISGLLVHFFMISNKITNLDDIVCVPGVGGGKALGRWFQEPLHDMFSPWSSPAVNGIMAIIFLSIAAAVIVTVFEIRTVTGAILIPLMMMTLPSTASNMYYMYLAPIFALAILMSAINVYLTLKYRFGWIPGAILQLLSMGCYQAYFGLSTSLLVLAIILLFVDGEPVADTVEKGVQSLLSLICSMGMYLISLSFVKEELSDYKGLSNIGGTSVTDILLAILRAYHRVMQYFVTSPESFMEGTANVFNIILVVLLFILTIVVMVRRKVFADKVRGILTVILLLILPLALGLVYVMAPELSHASTVMIYSYVVVYFMLITLVERLIYAGGGSAGVLRRCLPIVVCIMLLLEAYASARVVGNAYYRSYVAQNRVMEYYNRIITRLESADGYNYGDEFAILGGFYPERVPVAYHYMFGRMLNDFEGATVEDQLFLSTHRERFIQIWMGLNTASLTEEEKQALMNTHEFEDMPAFPADGCVRKIDGIWVIKMGRNDSKSDE